MLSVADRARVEQAIREAEARTRGEFVCVISEESFESSFPLLWLFGVAAFASLLTLALFAFIVQMREGFMGWIASPSASQAAPTGAVAIYMSIQCIMLLVVLLLVSSPAVRRTLIPRALKSGFVRRRALEQFVSKGLTRTKARTGVLLYVALKDRCVEVIADSGLNDKVAPGTWSKAVKVLLSGVRKQRTADGIIGAIWICTRELAQHYPADAGDPNELPDALTELTEQSDPT